MRGDVKLEVVGKESLPPRRSQAVYRETHDVASATSRLIRAVGKRIASEDPDGLDSLRLLQEAIDEAWRTAVDGLRASGYSDRDIGDELGVTRQAVEQRWPRSAGS